MIEWHNKYKHILTLNNQKFDLKEQNFAIKKPNFDNKNWNLDKNWLFFTISFSKPTAPVIIELSNKIGTFDLKNKKKNMKNQNFWWQKLKFWQKSTFFWQVFATKQIALVIMEWNKKIGTFDLKNQKKKKLWRQKLKFWQKLTFFYKFFFCETNCPSHNIMK